MRNPSTLDVHLFTLINRRYTNGVLDWFFARFTHFGLGGVQLPLVALVWWFHRHEAAGATMPSAVIGSFLVATGFVHLIKRRVKRLRPVAHTEVRFLVPETRHGSMPSGHTATTFALATVLAWHFPLWTLPLLIVSALIGYSRVYVGVHFLSDVLVAAVIGVVSALLCIPWPLSIL